MVGYSHVLLKRKKCVKWEKQIVISHLGEINIACLPTQPFKQGLGIKVLPKSKVTYRIIGSCKLNSGRLADYCLPNNN